LLDCPLLSVSSSMGSEEPSGLAVVYELPSTLLPWLETDGLLGALSSFHPATGLDAMETNLASLPVEAKSLRVAHEQS